MCPLKVESRSCSLPRWQQLSSEEEATEWRESEKNEMKMKMYSKRQFEANENENSITHTTHAQVHSDKRSAK